MGKVNVKIRLMQNDDEVLNIEKKALKNNNCITLYENDNTSMKIVNGINEVTIERENNEIYLKLNFKHNECLDGIYNIKQLNSNINIKTFIKKLFIEDQKIKIEYDLFIDDINNDKFCYELEWSDNL